MKCPHCQNDMKRRERTGTCTKCKKRYALDPKTNDFALHDARLVKLVHKLTDGGKLLVADEHLNYFLARKTAVATSGGCLPLLLALMTGIACAAMADASPPIVFVAPVLLLALGLYQLFIRKPRPFPRASLKPTAALRTTLDAYKSVYGALPPGLLLASDVALHPGRCVPYGPLHAVVVSPSAAVIDSLRINDIPANLSVGLLCTTRPHHDDAVVLQHLRSRPDLTVLLFHDASPAGCLLAEDLPNQLGLRPEHRILDMGLFPRRSIARKRLCLGVPVDPRTLARLKHRSLPASTTRALRPARAALTATELTWLAEGRTSPVESLMPRDLIQRVTAACARLAPKESREQAAVRKFGFMTRPPRPA